MLVDLGSEQGRHEVATAHGRLEALEADLVELNPGAVKQTLAEFQRVTLAEYRQLERDDCHTLAMEHLAAVGYRRCDALVGQLVGGCYQVGRLVQRWRSRLLQ